MPCAFYSKATSLKVRLQRLEQNIHNVHSRKNTIQEVALRKIRVVAPKPSIKPYFPNSEFNKII